MREITYLCDSKLDNIKGRAAFAGVGGQVNASSSKSRHAVRSLTTRRIPASLNYKFDDAMKYRASLQHS
jgi:hypothetical protein